MVEPLPPDADGVDQAGMNCACATGEGAQPQDCTCGPDTAGAPALVAYTVQSHHTIEGTVLRAVCFTVSQTHTAALALWDRHPAMRMQIYAWTVDGAKHHVFSGTQGDFTDAAVPWQTRRWVPTMAGPANDAHQFTARRGECCTECGVPFEAHPIPPHPFTSQHPWGYPDGKPCKVCGVARDEHPRESESAV